MNDSVNAVDYTFVSLSRELDQLCDKWSHLPVLALDTEFIRVNTFYPKPGLIQVCDGQDVYLLDPLDIDDFSSFKALLNNPAICKVLHSSSEDLVLFLNFFGMLPEPLFDTQKAAAFLGYGPSISYQNLVNDMTGIALGKGETRSNWLHRPLSEQQLHYAALDVKYLPELYKRLCDQLHARDRLAMFQAECAAMIDTAVRIEDEASWPNLYQQMGAAWRLNTQQLGVLQLLGIWREQQARLRDTPRTWVARDADLIQIAERMPETLSELKSLKEMSRNLYNKDADAILALVCKAEPVPQDVLENIDGAPLNHHQRVLLKKMQKAVGLIAKQSGIAEELLARKKVLIRILRLNENVEDWNMIRWPSEVRVWQQTLLHEPIAQALGVKSDA
ncbi:ribonuclease D [Pseudohongiella spirulinae]|uniref:Ribonuclease D n=1 Tax=Pseudohongiella spirulinae TaxID=1249552 RepID=A0A0S2KDE5_9GAMM|nr:ribonuclease D [Pseudohongiella spirulinae]ALO46131.1 Ribonuclease D [Pseudohongiella spirulinae]